MALHLAQDKRGTDDALEPKRQARIKALRKEAARTREFLANNPRRTNRQGQELKTIAGRGRQVTRFESKPKESALRDEDAKLQNQKVLAVSLG